jgi:hypothetical protein
MTTTNLERRRSEAQWYRSEAQACRDIAEKVSEPGDKAAWLWLAQDWIALAEQAEGHRL